jgi:hypothetical protein
MPLYSIIIQDDGEDVLIPQVTARGPKDAVIKWAQNMNLKEWPGIGPKVQQLLIEELKENTCVKVNERINMWCTGAYPKGKFFSFYILKTEEK